MASSPKLLGKREREDGSETEPILKKHKEPSDDKETEEGFAETLQQTESDHESLAPANETKEFADTLQQTRATLIPVKRDTVEGLDHFLEETEEFADTLQQTRATLIPVKRDTVEGLDHFLEETEEFADTLQQTRATLIPVKRDTVEGLDHFLEETEEGFADTLQQTESDHENLAPATPMHVRNKTLYVKRISRHTTIPDIINFFKDVGQVVRVRLTVNKEGRRLSTGFIDFASATEAKKALGKNKRGSSVRNPRPLKYCIDYKVWCEDHFLQESLPVDEDEAVERLVEAPDCSEAAVARKRTLLVANLSPQTKMNDIINFFSCVGQVVSVRLIVNQEKKNVGFAFVEFAKVPQAKKALWIKNGEYLHDHIISLHVAKTVPYPLRPKYNLVEKLWYEDFLLRASSLIEEGEGLDKPPYSVEADAVREKTVFVFNLPSRINISDIINFFHYVGEVVHVRLMVNHNGKQPYQGLVEFASSSQAEKALEMNREHLQGRMIFLYMSKEAPFPRQYEYYFDHKVWYEDYLQQENRLIDEDEAVEGPDETSDFVEEVALRKRTVFVSNLSPQMKLRHVIDFFKDVGLVAVRLCVNEGGRQHVGCGFVEFESVKEANKAWRKKNGEFFYGRSIQLDVVEIPTYPLRPKYNLAEKLWYERESSLPVEDDSETESNPKKLVDLYCGKKIIFSDED